MKSFSFPISSNRNMGIARLQQTRALPSSASRLSPWQVSHASGSSTGNYRCSSGMAFPSSLLPPCPLPPCPAPLWRFLPYPNRLAVGQCPQTSNPLAPNALFRLLEKRPEEHCWVWCKNCRKSTITHSFALPKGGWKPLKLALDSQEPQLQKDAEGSFLQWVNSFRISV